MISKKNFDSSILNMPRFAKQIIAMICDLSLCLISVVIAFYLRLDQLVPLKGPILSAALVSVLFALPIFWLTGMYRTIFRYSDFNIFITTSFAIALYGLLYLCCFTLYQVEGVPRSIGIIQPMILFFGITFSRYFIKFIFSQRIFKEKKLLKNTLIYGAGSSGRQIAISLENSFEYKVIGFLDDDYSLQGQILQGCKIFSPDELKMLISSSDIDLILLALPSISRFKRNKILNTLRAYKVKVQTLPTVSDIISGKITISDIKELDINDLLNRETIPPVEELLFKNINSKVVLVTGAGGSIGSELCRQIISAKPECLVLCELSEFSLYKIYDELISMNKNLRIIPLICNILDENKINEILRIFRVETIYHAAAYKHVPLVESNICEGLKNNVFGTYILAKASIEHGVSDFVLISSDKAVRPTNIMGATKRLAELCVKGLYHHHQSHNTRMSMVRFGNVIESSGSVIPKFKQQIKQGGPITLTHLDVTRYFMTIPEAAQLVMQAGAMSEKCDVFVLDMGKPVKIKDLIYRIVELSGLTIKNEKYPNGDIEIEIIGLRPGEKLYEELLLGDNPQPTAHKKIKKAQDPYIQITELEKYLTVLKSHITDNKVADIKLILKKILNSYQSDYKIVDYLYNEKVSLNQDGIDQMKYSENAINVKKFSKEKIRKIYNN